MDFSIFPLLSRGPCLRTYYFSVLESVWTLPRKATRHDCLADCHIPPGSNRFEKFRNRQIERGSKCLDCAQANLFPAQLQIRHVILIDSSLFS